MGNGEVGGAWFVARIKYRSLGFGLHAKGTDLDHDLLAQLGDGAAHLHLAELLLESDDIFNGRHGEGVGRIPP